MTFKEYTLRIPRNTLLYMSHFLSISANESFRAAAEEGMYKVLKHYAEQCKSNSPCFIKFNLSKNKSGETFTLKCRLVQGQIQECYILKVSKGLKSEHLSKFKEQFFQRIEKVCQVSQQVSRRRAHSWGLPRLFPSPLGGKKGSSSYAQAGKRHLHNHHQIKCPIIEVPLRDLICSYL